MWPHPACIIGLNHGVDVGGIESRFRHLRLEQVQVSPNHDQIRVRHSFLPETYTGALEGDIACRLQPAVVFDLKELINRELYDFRAEVVDGFEQPLLERNFWLPFEQGPGAGDVRLANLR